MVDEKTTLLLEQLKIQASRTRKRRSRLRTAILALSDHGDWRAIGPLYQFLDEPALGMLCATAIQKCLGSLLPSDIIEFDQIVFEQVSKIEPSRLIRWPIRVLDVEGAEVRAWPQEILIAVLIATAGHTNQLHRERAVGSLAKLDCGPLGLGILLRRTGDDDEIVRDAARRALEAFFAESKVEDFIQVLPLISQLRELESHPSDCLDQTTEFLATPGCFSELLEAMPSLSPMQKLSCFAVIEKSDPAGRALIYRSLLKDEDAEVRDQAQNQLDERAANS